MKVRLIFCSIFILIAVIFLSSCGESGEKTTKIIVPVGISINDEEIKVTEVVEINFAAEEAAVRTLHKSHDNAVNGRDLDGNIDGPPEANKIMELWLDNDSVLVAHTFSVISLLVEQDKKYELCGLGYLNAKTDGNGNQN